VGDSKIEWTDKTWNPVVGCTKVSAGCKNCYAKALHDQRHKAHGEGKAVPAQYAKPFEVVQLMPERLRDPLSWRKPQRVFVNSVSDLFHQDIPDEFIDKVFAVMGVAHWHTFQVLTKRPERMAAYFAEKFQVPAVSAGFIAGIDIPATPARVEDRWSRINAACDELGGPLLKHDRFWTPEGELIGRPAWPRKPFGNVWLGASVENQAAADQRIPHLLATPGAVRFLSCEPLLGPVDLSRWLPDPEGEVPCDEYDAANHATAEYDGLVQCAECGHPKTHHRAHGLGWVIVGGESGPGARPMAVEWARSLVKQCKAAGAPVFVKQMGSNPTSGNGSQSGIIDLKVRNIKDKKGGDPVEWPEDLRVRQFPEVPA
jgi:protein gp37